MRMGSTHWHSRFFDSGVFYSNFLFSILRHFKNDPITETLAVLINRRHEAHNSNVYIKTSSFLFSFSVIFFQAKNLSGSIG